LGRSLGLRRFFLGVLAAETFYSTGGVHQLLFAGKERMASGANFYVDVALMGRAGAEAVAARAHNANFVVSGMYGCFHDLLTSVPSFSRNYSILKDGRRIQQMELPGGVSRKPENDHVVTEFCRAASFELTPATLLGHY
jgi:hypothetical protein